MCVASDSNSRLIDLFLLPLGSDGSIFSIVATWPHFLWQSLRLPALEGQAELTWVVGYSEIVYPSVDGHPSKYLPGPASINLVEPTTLLTKPGHHTRVLNMSK